LVLLSDYTGALQTLDPIDFDNPSKENPNAPWAQIFGCRATAYYYMSFSFLMLRRYDDCIQTLTTFLTWCKDYHFDNLNNEKVNSMLTILTIAIALCHQALDVTVLPALQDKMEERLARMQRGELGAFQDAFEDCAPKFISVIVPSFEENRNPSQEAYHLQWNLFAAEVKQRQNFPNTSAFLQMCRSIELQKLSNLLDMNPEDLTTTLLTIKHKSRNKTMKEIDHSESKTSKGGRAKRYPIEGKWKIAGPCQFYVDRGMIEVAQPDMQPQYGNTFIQETLKLEDLTDVIVRGS